MTDYKILDDVLSIEQADEIEALLTAVSFPWYCTNRFSTVDEPNYDDSNIFEYLQFVHLFCDWDEGKTTVNSRYYNQIANIINPLCDGDKIVRIKANYKTQCRSGTEDMHTTPHIDMRLQQDGSPDGFRVEFPHTVIIYYVNDSDGDTFLFNSNGTEMTRVEPKKGRFLIFDGQIYHAGSFPIHHLDRIVINYNIE